MDSRHFLPGAGPAFLLLFACGIAAAEEKPTQRAEPSLTAPPGQKLEWTTPQGKNYWYRLPAKVDPRKPVNLILMLHGTGLDWRWSFYNYPISPGNFRRNDIVVSPDGMTPGQGGTFNFIQNKADGDHIAELIGFFKKRLPVQHVYLYGHSQGAFFAYWFAGEHPEIVDGIVAHAGNVLDVKHPRLAREKVAIGILHSSADAVVPVECAYRTEKIYKELGYKKIKMEIVEGMNAQSGHWPLPKQVGEMLDWLDAVSADTPGAAIDGALLELGKDAPDLSVVVESSLRAARLLKAARSEGKGPLADKASAIRELLDEAGKSHAAALAARPKAQGVEPFGSWAVRFRLADKGLDEWPAWQKEAKPLRSRAASQEKPVAEAINLLEKTGGKNFADALKAFDASFLSSRHDDLGALLGRAAQKPPAGVKPADVEKFNTLVASRQEAAAEGAKAFQDANRALARAFREKHADWYREGDSGKQE